MGVLAAAVTIKFTYFQIDKNQLLLCQCSGSKGFDMIGKKKVGIKDDGLGVKRSMKEDIRNTARLDLAAS